ncbi:hypothetical protein LR48_Vigan08g160000 [Vigna angularis]|uniref:Uncharacterized protein n=1 Tax=Phaseolus angularis TaxID=3914 RepID=A0A0L9V711_PHAAN|nr:hypothetical protein LR48_Vigan08g160000 [Vigna angularis]
MNNNNWRRASVPDSQEQQRHTGKHLHRNILAPTVGPSAIPQKPREEPRPRRIPSSDKATPTRWSCRIIARILPRLTSWAAHPSDRASRPCCDDKRSTTRPSGLTYCRFFVLKYSNVRPLGSTSVRSFDQTDARLLSLPDVWQLGLNRSATRLNDVRTLGLNRSTIRLIDVRQLGLDRSAFLIDVRSLALGHAWSHNTQSFGHSVSPPFGNFQHQASSSRPQ